MTVAADVRINLLELKPQRIVSWEMEGGDKVVLLVPKFRNRFVVKWFVPMLAKPNIRVKLDDRGSFVWQRCDGETTVQQIGEQMSAAFTEPIEATYERIGKFIHQLVRGHSLVAKP